MSPRKKQTARKATPAPAAKARVAADSVRKRTKTRKADILQSAHLHRSRAHTSSVGRRRQARRDAK